MLRFSFLLLYFYKKSIEIDSFPMIITLSFWSLQRNNFYSIYTIENIFQEDVKSRMIVPEYSRILALQCSRKNVDIFVGAEYARIY